MFVIRRFGLIVFFYHKKEPQSDQNQLLIHIFGHKIFADCWEALLQKKDNFCDYNFPKSCAQVCRIKSNHS